MTSPALSLTCSEADLESLFDWLRAEPALRGHVSFVAGTIKRENLGALSTILVNVLTPGSIAALAASLSVWLRQRRPDIKIEVKGPTGSIFLEAKRIPDAEKLLHEILSGAGSIEHDSDPQ